MSRMPVRQTVQTCLLSRRWRHLWRSSPCLNLHRAEFFKPSYGLPTQAELHPPPQQLDQFQCFGDSLLLNREAGSCLGTLSLHLRDTHVSRMDPGRWMRYAFSRCNLREFRYEIFGGPHEIKMPPDLGPSLTRLHLRNLSLDERFAEMVASVCVALGILELEECAICCSSFTSNSLGSLVIHRGYIDGNNKGRELVITAPHLTSLRIHDWCTLILIRVSVNEMFFLEKASMLIGYPQPEKSFQRCQLKLLSTLCNVTSLELSGFLHKMLPDVKPVEFPSFMNLRTLLLFECKFFEEMNYCGFSDNFQLLVPLLQNSPKLEKVTMRSRQLARSVIFNIPKFAELVYDNVDDIQELVHFLLGVSDRVPKNILALHQSSMSK